MTRAGDLFWCGLSAPLLAPLFLLIALAILLDDGAPVLFRQQRTGRGRRPFCIYKFRSMRGQRITRVGYWLRRSGLDESAQWFNVLKGDMSWIGPRPLTAADIERLGWSGSEHAPRFSIRPGITGLAQLLGGSGSGWTRGVDRLYRQERGPRLDSWIILWSLAVNALGKSRVRRLLSRPGAARQ
jgi:lipopolysaccharide/colanic/teichoic acid biosynthesis glycosyltransferase